MPRSYRRSRLRRWRRWGRAYRARTLRRRYRSTGIVNSRSRMRIRIPLQTQLTVQIPATSTAATSVCINPWANTTNSTGNNVAINDANGQSLGFVATNLWRAYAALFDEVKFDGMRVKAAVIDTIGTGGTYAGVTVASVIERNCNKEDIPPNSTNMSNWSSYSFRNVINNSVAKISRSVWARDLNEKIQFSDVATANGGAGTAVAAPGNYLRAWRDGSNTATFFKPAIYLTASPATAAAALRTITFMCEVTGYFTFRCPKYSVSGSSKDATDFLATLDATKDAQVDDKTLDTLIDEDTLHGEDTLI